MVLIFIDSKVFFEIAFHGLTTLGENCLQIQCERLLRVQTLAGSGIIPLYVMTSAATRQKTEAFFVSNNFFGLDQNQVMFFDQGTHPCFDMSGKVLLATKSSIARSPDG